MICLLNQSWKVAYNLCMMLALTQNEMLPVKEVFCFVVICTAVKWKRDLEKEM